MHKFFRRNTLTGSRKNIAAHYDLSNDLFATFLGKKFGKTSVEVFFGLKGRVGRGGICNVRRSYERGPPLSVTIDLCC